jgi:hypothetical protein
LPKIQGGTPTENAKRRGILCRVYINRGKIMSSALSNDQELVSDLVACQLVIKQILDVIDVIAPTEVRDKMASQLKSIDFSSHPAGADPITKRAIEKAIALIEMKFNRE